MKTLTKYAKQNRKRKTPAEKRLHVWLSRWRIKFRSQRPFDRYIVDFVIPDRRVVIEVDGSSHVGKEENDRIRQEYLESKGLIVLRYTNEHVLTTDCDDIRQMILSYPEQPIDDWRKAYGFAAF